jgi:glycosyltransferase involved in cell wall biosynthesis
MKEIYAQAKVILMPSLWEEAWGRVASEAHYSGIPVVASNRGGLTESVGPGGVTLDPDEPINNWVDVIRRFWTDDAYYNEKSAAAIGYAKRPDIDPAHQTSKLIDIMTQAIRIQDAAGKVRTTRKAAGLMPHETE